MYLIIIGRKILLVLHKNLCCGCLLELPGRVDSNESGRPSGKSDGVREMRSGVRSLVAS